MEYIDNDKSYYTFKLLPDGFHVIVRVCRMARCGSIRFARRVLADIDGARVKKCAWHVLVFISC